MSKNNAEIKINLNASNFQKGMRVVNKSFKSLKDNIVAANQAVDLFSRIKAPLMANIHAAGIQEKAFKSLDITLRNTGRHTKEYQDNLINLAQTMSGVSIYGTENIIQGMDMLMRYTGISSEQIPQATQVMLDLASVMEVDVATAAKLLGQSSEEMTGALARYGIRINPVIAASGDFSKILTEIERKVKGHAKAMASTGYGGFLRMQGAVADTTKAFGTFALEVGKSGAFNTLQIVADSAAKELDKIFTPERAKKAADGVLTLTHAGLLGIHSVLGVMDKIPGNILELGIVGYLLLGKKGILIGSVIGAGLDAMGINLGEQVESLIKSTEISAETIEDKIAQAEKRLNDKKSYIKSELSKILSSDEINKIVNDGYVIQSQRLAQIGFSYIESGEPLKAAFDLEDNEHNAIRKLEKEVQNLISLKDKFLNGEEIDLGKSGFGLARDAIAEIAKSLDDAGKSVKNIGEQAVSGGINSSAETQKPYTAEQYRLLDELAKKTALAQRELELLKFSEGFIRDSEAINLQAQEYINNAGLAATDVDKWRDAQIGLLEAQRQINEERKREGEILKQAEAAHNAAMDNAIKEMDMKSNAIKGAFGSMSAGIADALYKGTTEGLVSALADSIKMFAAQKTAHLLMEAAYHTAMIFIDPYNIQNAGIPHSSSALMAAKAAAMMGTFVMASNIKGMAHSGMDYIPKEGTWLLDKGERVVDSRTNKDLKEFLSSSGAGQNITINVTINDGDKDSVLDALPVLQKVIVDTVSQNIANGGQIKRVIKDYS